MSKLTTATRIMLGFSIAPLALLVLLLYALSGLATLKEQASSIVAQDWPKVAPIMHIATGVRDNARNTRDLLINKDNRQAQQSIESTKAAITQALDTLEPLLYLPKGQALFVQLKSNRQAYVAAFTQVLGLIKLGQQEDAAAQLQSRVVPAELAVYRSLDELMALQ
jgi:methyl-accepting chemotaxis protein